jgi:hypothetical protein
MIRLTNTTPHRSWRVRLLATGAGMFVVGWALVVAFGGNANAGGATRVVWRVGGLLLYGSVLVLLAVGLATLVVALRRYLRRASAPRA